MKKVFLQVYDSFYDIDSNQIFTLDEVLRNEYNEIIITDTNYKLDFVTDEELYDSRNNLDMIDLPPFFVFEHFENNRYVSFNGKRVIIPSQSLVDNILKKAEQAKSEVVFLSLEKFVFDPFFTAKRVPQHEMYSKLLCVLKITNFIFMLYSDNNGELVKSFFKCEESITDNMSDINTFVQTYIDTNSLESKEFACFTNIKELQTNSEFIIKNNIEMYNIDFNLLKSKKYIEKIKFITIYDYLDFLCGNKLVKHIRYFTIILVISIFYWFSAFTNNIIIHELNNNIRETNYQLGKQKEKVGKIIRDNNIKFIPLVYDYVHNKGKTYSIINSVFDIILITISFDIEGYSLIGYDYSNVDKKMLIFFRRLPIYSVYTESAFISEFKKLTYGIKHIYKIKDNIMLDSNNQIIQLEVLFK